MSGSSQIDDLYDRGIDTLSTSGTSMVHHYHHGSDTMIATTSAELFNESNCLGTMTDTGGYTYQSGNGPVQSGNTNPLTNVNTGSNFTITGTGHIVINLQNFVLTGGTFTLEGTAATTFVFNVSKSFALSGGTKIVLANLGGVANGPDGVQASNVIFNVKGTGPDVAISGSTIFQGILLANNRNVKISGGSVPRGEIIGNKVTLSDGVQLYPASP